MPDTLSGKEKKIELTKIVEEGDTNNYNEFEMKAVAKLKAHGYWKYIEGPRAVPPTIPKLIPERRFKAKDPDTGQEKEFVELGNRQEVEKALQDGDLGARKTSNDKE